MFLVRPEEVDEFYANSKTIFFSISFLILIITFTYIAYGIYILRHIIRFIEDITSSLMRMQENQKLKLIDLSDALLSVYCTLDSPENKSLQAVRSAYIILNVASVLRKKMALRKKKLVKLKRTLTESEKRVFRAVLIEIGVE